MRLTTFMTVLAVTALVITCVRGHGAEPTWISLVHRQMTVPPNASLQYVVSGAVIQTVPLQPGSYEIKVIARELR